MAIRAHFWLAGALTVFVPGFVYAAVELTTDQQVAAPLEDDVGDQSRIDFFEAKIRPLLAGHCYNCHSADTNSQGGLRVDDRNGLLAGGGRGPAVVPGDPEGSLLVRAVRRTHDQVKMPPEHPLSEEQIADVVRWIDEGAAWPQENLAIADPPAEYAAWREHHWAWQPLRKPPVPDVSNAAWPMGEIDRFVLARLEAAGLRPVADADPLTLIRRLTFDLAGRPPTPVEISEIVAACEAETPDARQVALAAAVDRLLASPAFGERWGRHWLDVARYGESTGGSRNVPYPHAWRYRDYVIDAFNADKPFDRFIREQIAGDLLPADMPRQRDEQQIATGFLALGVCDVNQRFKVRFVMDNVDEQIDAVSRAFLGLTASCARCHDHKFDPIPTADYYALAGIFRSSERCAAVRNKMGGGGMDYYDSSMLLRLSDYAPATDVPARIEQTQAALASAREQLKTLETGDAAGQATDADQSTQETDRKQQLNAARKHIAGLQETLFDLNDPAFHGPVAFGVREAATIGDTEVRIRGEAERLGPTVPRGFLSVVSIPDAPSINPGQSGRLELAAWLTSPHNPLTARVMANRIWQHLFGQGLVRTVDNFGLTGDAPSHPELLDYLATQFIDESWSVKRMVRAIVLSRAYQLASDAPAENLALDPENRLIWRHRPRRLDAEEIRDCMLAASGQIDWNRPAGSPVQGLRVRELNDDGGEARNLAKQAQASRHRSVYLPLLRGLTPQSLSVFDFAEQGMVSGSRATTTVAPQALYLLNDPFVIEQSQALARRLLADDGADDSQRIEQAYLLTVGRPATRNELLRALGYIVELRAIVGEQSAPEADRRHSAWTSFCQAVFASAEFRYLR
jgi:hypothetical protein